MREFTLSMLLSFAGIFNGCSSPPPQRTVSQPAQTNVQTLSSPVEDGAEKVVQLRETEKIIWSGTTDGLSIRWTTHDLYVGSLDSTAKIFSTIVESDYKDFAADQSIKLSDGTLKQLDCDYQRELKVLSVVGTQVSFEDEYYILCGSHPDLGIRFTTINVEGGSSKIIKLTDYFPEKDILDALLADRLIRKALAHLNTSSFPKTLSELLTLLERNDYRLGDSDSVLPIDFLSRFAFHHIEGDRVAIRIGLPSSSVANHAVHKQLGLLLPIPAELDQPLTLAANNQQGFLMKDALKISGEQTSSFAFNTKGKE